jgi:hypothetical protein
MKQLTALAICLLIAGSSFGQAPKKGKKEALPMITVLPQRNKAFHKSAIGGFCSDVRRHPVKGVKAYVYAADSSIIGSGYTDSTGYYETNSFAPGVYDLKISYPNNKFSVMITGVPVLKAKITNISFLRASAPEADTAIVYADIAPKPVEKAKKVKK